MIRRHGAQEWNNIHITVKSQLRDLIDIDNSALAGPTPRAFDLLKQVASECDQIVTEARQQGRHIRVLGSGWALTDIAGTDGWLINSKLLNGHFEIASHFFEPGIQAERARCILVVQAGISIGELNGYLEVTAPGSQKRSLKTAGIGAGQTIAGAISGNTHGSAINFGAMPDFVVGLQLVTGRGKSLWIERQSDPVFNDEFVARLGADRIRDDDDVLDAAIVNLGAFGIITAVAIETAPMYQLLFPPVTDTSHVALKTKLNNFNATGLYHYEFIFDPYSADQIAMETQATMVNYEPGHPPPKPVWIPRTDKGFALGDLSPGPFFGIPLVSPAQKTGFQFDQYRKRCILGDVRATPGQLFTATVTYLEGYAESAIGISLNDAAKMLDISSGVIRSLQHPAMSQVRVVHPSRALLGFTQLGPKTAVFEFGLANDAMFRTFERDLLTELTTAGVPYTLHWSKNSGVDVARLQAMYSMDRINRWRQARHRVFDGDSSLMAVFENSHLIRAGLNS